jgi:sugar phosphate isomerase/epimerase
MNHHPPLSRRLLLASTAGALLAPACAALAADEQKAPTPTGHTGRPTEFQIACMTYVYRSFPIERALAGIHSAGFRYIAWGTEHQEEPGKRVPVLPDTAAPDAAARLARRCRDLGLEPVLMFSNVYPERNDGLDVLKRRIEQAHAAGIPQVLTFGRTEGAGGALWLERFKALGPLARDAGVTLVIKQHGGETGTGAACAKFTRELGEPNVKVSYDAGNVMDYLDVDPLADLKTCVDEVRSFCIKDHRNWPKDEDCGPGFGEIDHYRLLEPVAVGRGKLPLCCETVFPPLLPMPIRPRDVDLLAERARTYLEMVVTGLQTMAANERK